MGSTPLCDLEREHRVRLVVDQRLGAVDVLGLGVVQHTAAEGDDVAPQVEDGGHDPPPEQAVDAARLAALEQAAGVQLLLVVSLIPEVLVERLPVVGGIAQPEAVDGLVVEAAPPPVGPGLPGLLHRGVEAGVEEAGRVLVHGQDAAAQTARFVVLGGFGHPGPLGQQLDGLDVVDAVDPLGKAHRVAARAAAKAVEALGVRVDVERGGLLAVEGAQPAVEPALPLELDIIAHQLHDVGAAGQLFNVFVWDHNDVRRSFFSKTCRLRGTKTSSKVRTADLPLLFLSFPLLSVRGRSQCRVCGYCNRFALSKGENP